MTLVERLRHARHLAGVTGADLGVLAGLSKGAVSMIESGNRTDPSGSTVAALAKVLGISADWLLSGTEPEPDAKTVKAGIAAARALAQAVAEANPTKEAV